MIPLFPCRSCTRAETAASFFLGRRTSKKRFSRSKPVTTLTGSLNPSSCAISSRTRAVAVAVKAATGGLLGSFPINSAIFR